MFRMALLMYHGIPVGMSMVTVTILDNSKNATGRKSNEYVELRTLRDSTGECCQ